MRLYWLPFCVEMGTDWERPDYSDLNSDQKATEDKLKALFLPWCHKRMKGRKNKDKVALPTSVMNSLRNINRVLNRHANEEAPLKRASKVLKGMLTLYVRQYGPIQPDKALPFPKTVLERLLNMPDGTKLGKFTLNWTSQVGRNLRAMFEMAAQSGVRLDECTTGARDEWDLSKMSMASAVWYIGGQYVHDPTPLQLRSLTERDGLCLTPATSKCDRWGDKHGGKIMFFPFRPTHLWNGCRAMRDRELYFPVKGEARLTTPLFTSSGKEPMQASFVRTVLNHMLRHPHMSCVNPDPDKTKYTFHSFRKFYCTGLKRAGASVPTIQSLCRWSAAESVDGYDMPSPEDHAKLVDSAYAYSPNAITPALLTEMRSFKIDDDDSLLAWGEECHVDLTAEYFDW